MTVPCINKSKRKQLEAQRAYDNRPLTPYERRRADEVLIHSLMPDGYVMDAMRRDVLVTLGLRKGEPKKS
jgi:hypothetical protein